jgi:hypothetical protein
MRLSTCLIAIACLILAATPASAQTDRGTITGTVSDPAGAVIPSASIEAQNTGTEAIYRIAGTSTGNYTLAQLPAGIYRLTVSAPGFKQYVQSGITVQVAQTLRIDISLEIGSPVETVTVNADATLLKTETGELSHVVTGDTLSNLPLLGFNATSTIRSPYDVTQLVPGALFVGGLFSTIRVNGAPANTEGFRVEGQDATNSMSITQTAQNQPSADAIEEFAIQTSNYAAEYGQAGGGFYNVTMKSGTNSFHGTAYDYFINEALNASQSYGGTKNRVRRNNYGFTLGGPVIIPKVYNGHDKTFFFFNFERFQEPTVDNTTTYTVPTLAYRQGDFRQALTGKYVTTADGNTTIQEGTIYIPGTEHSVTGLNGKTYLFRDPFMGCDGKTLNVICMDPQSPFYTPINPVAKKIQDMFPPPTGPYKDDLLNNYLVPWNKYNNRTIPSVKIDHSFGSRSKISGYWSMTRMRSIASGCDAFSDLPFSTCRQSLGDSHTVRLNYDINLTPTKLLHLGAGIHTLYWRDDASSGDYDQQKELGIAQPSGINGMRFPRITGWYSSTTGGGLAPAGASPATAAAGPLIQSQSHLYKPTANASLTWVKTNHTYKFGAEMRVEGYPTQALNPSYGVYNFSNTQTSIPTQGYVTSTIAPGFAYASFLLGYFDNGNIAPVTTPRVGKSAWGLFAQDSWKVTRRFTLDYGLRWDYQGYLNDSHGRIANFSPTTPNPAVGDLLGGMIFETGGVKFSSVYRYAFGPRLGGAFQITPKTVLRAGLGISYGQTANENRMSTTVGSNYPFSAPGYGAAWRTLDQGAPPDPSGTYVFPNMDPGQYNRVSGTPVPIASNFFDRGAGRPPRVFQWSIGLQREISKNLVVEVSYVGNRGVWWEGNELININALSADRLKTFGIDPNNAADRALLVSTMSSTTASNRINPVTGNPFSTLPYDGFPTNQTVAQSLRPFPQFTTITNKWSPLGKTWYDSMQIKVTKRFSHGLDFTSSFVWQKELVMGSESAGVTGGGNLGAVNNVFDRSVNKYISRFSRPYVSLTSLSYTLPKLNGNRVLSWAIRDWKFGAILTYSSGMPIQAPTAANSVTNQYFFQSTFMNRVPGEPLYAKPVRDSSGKVTSYTPIDINDRSTYDPYSDFVLNPAAWTSPTPGQYSYSAAYYNDYRMKRTPSERMSIGRIFRMKEGVTLEIRADFDNVFNRTVLPAPSSSSVTTQTWNAGGMTQSGFGDIRTVSGSTTQRSGIIVGRLRF